MWIWYIETDFKRNIDGDASNRPGEADANVDIKDISWYLHYTPSTPEH